MAEEEGMTAEAASKNATVERLLRNGSTWIPEGDKFLEELRDKYNPIRRTDWEQFVKIMNEEARGRCVNTNRTHTFAVVKYIVAYLKRMAQKLEGNSYTWILEENNVLRELHDQYKPAKHADWEPILNIMNKEARCRGI